MINLDEYADVGTHWIDFFCNRREIIYFDFLALNIFLKRLKGIKREIIGKKNIIANIFQVQANSSIICTFALDLLILC